MKISLLNFEWEKTASLLIDEINAKAEMLNVGYKEISEVLNVDSGYIHKVLNKKKDVTCRTFIRICLALIEVNNKKGEPIPPKELLPSSILRKVGL